MAFKLITVLCATLAFANAGLLAQTAYSAPVAHYAAAAPVAHYSSAPAVSHVYSSIGAVQTQQRAVLAHAAAPVVATQAYAAPAYAHSTYAAPAYAHSAYAAPAYAHSTYAAPAYARSTYAAPAYAHSTYAVAPAVKTIAAAPVLHAPIAKVAYSPASEVSHVYSSIAAPQYAYGAPLAIHAPAVGSSQQNTYRTHAGTISHSSKAVNTAFSSDIRADTRISNNVYTPALATKTIAYQQPAILEQKHIPATVVSHVAFDGIGAHYNW